MRELLLLHRFKFAYQHTRNEEATTPCVVHPPHRNKTLYKTKKMSHIPAAGSVFKSGDTTSVVLDIGDVTGYNPDAKEIEEYGLWLGLNRQTDHDLFLEIAVDGLKAPLPEDWKPCKTDKDEVYYFNFSTGESIWDHPADDEFRTRAMRAKFLRTRD